MIKLINNNPNLYKPDYKSYRESLEFAKTLDDNKNNNLIFHCFWRVPRDFSRKQLAVLKSIIVNHKNDLNNLEINLWSNVDLSKNIHIQEVLPFINLKIWDFEKEIQGTILEDSKHITKEYIYDNNCYLEGDLFRLLILHKYGGFYIDMDVLVLRNMLPLNNMQFLYQWGTSGFNHNEPQITMNGAIMRLEKNSPLSYEFLELLTIIPGGKDSFGWGNQLYSNINKNDLLVLPGVWFNSEWGFEGTSCSPFKRVDNIELFEGAFTWHWHNRWDEPIETGSKFEFIESKNNELFKNL